MAKKIDVVSLIAAVKENPIIWDSRHEQYKLSKNKPLVWAKIAEELHCEKSKLYAHLNRGRSSETYVIGLQCINLPT